MILVVDDNEYSGKTLQELLEYSGYETKSVDNVSKAIESCRHTEYKVILTDIHMPGMNGIEFIEYLEKEQSSALVIIQSAYLSKSEMKSILHYENLFAVHTKSDFIEKVLISVKKAVKFYDLCRQS